MRNRDVIEGLLILQNYYDNPDGFNFGAGHDQIYAYTTDKPLPKTAVARMVELGWFQPEVIVPDDEGFGAKHYEPAEGWSAYV